jgi:hypothetical protein
VIVVIVSYTKNRKEEIWLAMISNKSLVLYFITKCHLSSFWSSWVRKIQVIGNYWAFSEVNLLLHFCWICLVSNGKISQLLYFHTKYVNTGIETSYILICNIVHICTTIYIQSRSNKKIFLYSGNWF